MNAPNEPKKTTPHEDWHRADIYAALRKKGWSLRQLSLTFGLSQNTLRTALDRPWPKAERIIAATIEVPPETIWPSRYAARATPELPPLAAAMLCEARSKA
ncbi:helix-turn-helix transcriptional regulator [Aquitalea sp. LB_tupeE]|uniref:helix-turn-helix domain-containing protein n=1 Tax=Aquitalea sp. LB_tupeE TaxID=2748078 RepID=UPI0015BB49E0|nr:helix-turn-helix transcriptional regulator [Aquitalea sp. LB_tupeE]NWK80330.1 helix-turn-helix domain-containing protein [Aquitalea sp. LB_tupeE]